MNDQMISVGDARLLVQRQLLEGLARIGAALMVGLAVLKAVVPLVGFPAWDLDPMSMPATVVGLGPTAMLSIDCVIITLAGAVMALAGPVVGRPRLVEMVLLFGGIAAVAWHGFFAPDANQANLLLGISWAAAMAAAASLAHAARIESIRRVGSAIVIGFVALLAFKAAAQVWVEIPQTISAYEADRMPILAAHGWSPDSFAAKTFERRLRDTSATGWFGLSNIVASFGAAGVGVFFVLARERGANGFRRAAAVLGLVLSFLCVWLAGSKGGWAAALLACGIGFLGPWLAGKRAWRGAVVLMLIPLGTLAAVFVRGIVGTRLGELSLLFRSQYLVAAGKIFGHNVLSGVGPAGFKDAYLILKSPLSPEEVSSPHSVLFDFAATLGVGGVLWGVLWLSLVGAAGIWLALAPNRDEVEESNSEAGESANELAGSLRPALLTLAAVSLAGAWVEMPLATPINGVVRMGGLIVAAVMAWRVCVAGHRALGLALSASAAALAFHAVIEMTPIQTSSCALYACFLGLAAAAIPGMPQARRWVLLRAGPGIALGLVGIAASLLVGQVQAWEGFLRAGADRLEPFSDLTAEIAEVTRTSGSSERLKVAATELSNILEKTVEPTPAALRRALLEAKRKRGGEALGDLVMAIAVEPTSADTRQAASHLALSLGAIDRELGESAADHLQQGLELAEDATQMKSRRASSYSWLATARRGVFEFEKDRRLLQGAFDASQAAAAFDPKNPMHAAVCARLALELGNAAVAKEWADRALQLDENMRLDPLRRFEEAERRQLEAMKRPLSGS